MRPETFRDYFQAAAANPIERVCVGCGESFEDTSGFPNRRFHSRACKDRYHSKMGVGSAEACSYCPRVYGERAFESKRVCGACALRRHRNGSCPRCRAPLDREGFGKGLPGFCPTHDGHKLWEARKKSVRVLLVDERSGDMRIGFRTPRRSRLFFTPRNDWQASACVQNRGAVVLVSRANFTRGSSTYVHAIRGVDDPQGLLRHHDPVLLEVDRWSGASRRALRELLPAILEHADGELTRRLFWTVMDSLGRFVSENTADRAWLRFCHSLQVLGVPHTRDAAPHGESRPLRFPTGSWETLLRFLEQRHRQRQNKQEWI